MELHFTKTAMNPVICLYLNGLNSKSKNKRKKTASPKANGFSYILNQVEPD